MAYYRCTKSDLHRELSRRGYRTFGDEDEAAEELSEDDSRRGSIATTISTVSGIPSSLYTWKPSPEYGQTITASVLTNERIVQWTLNTFFPTLHLFFESGLSCMIEGSQLPDAFVGLDPALRHRLTDLTHEEDGVVTSGTIIQKRSATPTASIRILEATVARRESIVVKNTHQVLSARTVTTIVKEQHTVVGLRLEGMDSMGYIWAKLPRVTVQVAGRMWGHVRIAGLRDDAPAPFGRFFQTGVNPGAGSKVVVASKESMVEPELRGRPTI